MYPWVCILTSKVGYQEFKEKLKEIFSVYRNENCYTFKDHMGNPTKCHVKRLGDFYIKSAIIMKSKPTAVISFLASFEKAQEFAEEFLEFADVDLRIGEIDYASEWLFI